MRLERRRIQPVAVNSVVFLAFLTALQLPAQEAAKPLPLTLEQAVDTALEQNPMFRTSLDEAQAARARLKEEQATWFPRFDFRQDFTRGNDPVYVFGTELRQRQFTAEDFALNQLNAPTPIDNFQTRLDAQWRLFDSGQTSFHQRSAKKLVTAADFQTEQARQDLILEVVRSYDAVLVLQENLRAADQAVKTAEASVQRMETMQQAGMIVDSDLLSAKVFLAQMKDRQIRTQIDLAAAGMELARQMGLSLDASPALAGTLAAPGPTPKTIQDWTQTALEQRPALRAAELQEAAMDQERKAAKADFGPKLGLFGSTERDAMAWGGPSGTNWTAGARLEINLFAGGAEKARLAEAAANAHKAKDGVEWLRSGVQMEVRKAYLDVNAAAQRAAASRASSEQAQESLRIVQNRYDSGLTTVTELLRAQTAQLDATTGYLSALQDWQVARAQLERAAGVLTPASTVITGAGNP
ncbi:MAG TPA: TolC family protein [Terriglobia bacterium]|nr:TolC family protein [Terriglobia bacterium]